MKKITIVILACVMCLTLCACGKSKAATECENRINAIGVVSIDSKEAIEAAEHAYSALTSEEKDSISASAVILEDAREAYYIEYCKEIFSKLNDAHEIVDQFGTDLYTIGVATENGFNFDKKDIYYLKPLLNEVNIHLTEEEMKQGIEAAVKGHNLLDGYDADFALCIANMYDVLGDLCVLGVSNAYKLTERVTTVRETLYEASVLMTELDGVDSCSQYSLILEKYYAAIDEFLGICLDFDSIEQIGQLGDMLSSYQGYVQTYTSDLKAMLGN